MTRKDAFAFISMFKSSVNLVVESIIDIFFFLPLQDNPECKDGLLLDLF